MKHKWPTARTNQCLCASTSSCISPVHTTPINHGRSIINDNYRKSRHRSVVVRWIDLTLPCGCASNSERKPWSVNNSGVYFHEHRQHRTCAQTAVLSIIGRKKQKTQRGCLGGKNMLKTLLEKEPSQVACVLRKWAHKQYINQTKQTCTRVAWPFAQSEMKVLMRRWGFAEEVHHHNHWTHRLVLFYYFYLCN